MTDASTRLGNWPRTLRRVRRRQLRAVVTVAMVVSACSRSVSPGPALPAAPARPVLAAVCGDHLSMVSAPGMAGDSLQVGFVPAGFTLVGGDPNDLNGSALRYEADGGRLWFQISRRVVPPASDLGIGMSTPSSAAVGAQNLRGDVGNLAGDPSRPVLAWFVLPDVAVAIVSYDVPLPVLQQIGGALVYRPGRRLPATVIPTAGFITRGAAIAATDGDANSAAKLVSAGEVDAFFATGVDGQPPLVGPRPALPAAVWVIAAPAATVSFVDPIRGVVIDTAAADAAVHAAFAALVDQDPRRCASPPAPGTWKALPASPAAGRTGATAVWTGTKAIIWGGADGQYLILHNDGAAYDPRTQDWQVVAPAPIDPRAGHVAVWAGTQMIVWGGHTPLTSFADDGAAYTPATDTWTRLPPAPVGMDNPAAVWTGAEMVVLSETPHDPGPQALAYNPSTSRWRALPRPPLDAVGFSLIWTGHEVLAVGGRENTLPGIGGSIGPPPGGAAYNPTTNAWRPLPAAPIYGNGVWDGAEVLALGTQANGKDNNHFEAAAFNPTRDTWRKLPAPGAATFGETITWTGTVLLATNTVTETGAAYDPRSDRWSTIPPSRLSARTGAASVWTGSLYIVWGGTINHAYIAAEDGSTFRPD